MLMRKYMRGVWHSFFRGSEETLYLGLGSNLGDREKNLRRAVEGLEDSLECHWTALSEFVETEPWGFESENKFLNAVVRFDVLVPYGDIEHSQEEFDEINTETAHKILKICKRIERKMGRWDKPEYDAEGHRIYKSRKIDIDILLFGDIKIDDPDLKIPHPLISVRPFVLEPLLQLAPELRDSILK